MAFLVILPIAMLCSVYFDKRIEETIGLSMIWAALLAYICGIVYRLDIAPVLLAVIAVISAGLTVFLAVKQKKLPKIFTIGLLEYLVLSGYYMLMMRGRYIIGQDGLRVYERYVADYYHVGDINRFRNPIGLMMWKYLSLKFWPNYSEGIQLLGPVMMCVAFLLLGFSFESKSKKETIIKSLIGLFFIVIIPLNFRGNLGYLTMQYDFACGMLTVYILCAYRRLMDKEDIFYKLLIVSGLIFLVQIKTNGFILAVVIVMIMAGMDMVQGKGEGLKVYRFSIISGIAVILSKLSWTVFCKLNDAEEKLSVSDALKKMNIVMIIAVILAIIAAAALAYYVAMKRQFKLYAALVLLLSAAIVGGTEVLMPGEIRVKTLVSFAKIVLSNFAVDRDYGLGSLFMMPFIIPIAALLCFYVILAKDGKDEVNRSNNYFLILVNLGFVLYSSVVFLTNYYARTITQTAKAKECERYLFTYVIVYIFVCLFLYMKDYDKSSNYRILMAVLVMVGFFMTQKSYLYSQLVERDSVETFDGLNNVEITAEDKFYYVDVRKEQDHDQFYFRSSPADKVKWDYMDMYLNEDGKDEPVSHEEWTELLSGCTYVYLATTDENFVNVYGDVFDDEIIDGHIYRVINDQSGVRLKSIQY